MPFVVLFAFAIELWNGAHVCLGSAAKNIAAWRQLCESPGRVAGLDIHATNLA